MFDVHKPDVDVSVARYEEEFPMVRLPMVLRVMWVVAVTCIVQAAPGARSLLGSDDAWNSPPAKSGGVVLKAVMIEDQDQQPQTAGRAAAEALKKAMAGVPLKAVIVSECFEDKPAKVKLLEGIASVLPADILLGGATYGSFTQAGSAELDAVSLLGIGGEGVSVAAALVTDLGTSKLVFEEHQPEIEKCLHAAGAKLAEKLRRTEQDRLLILIPDAHSPKNQFIVEGVQKVVGGQFPITGGCVNKNAGQTFVYFRGQPYEDSAVALMLSGDFSVSLAGRQAKENDQVISTAREAAAEAAARLKVRPLAALAFDCAGRKGKLKNVGDELAAVQQAIGKDLPLFGCYCAGEIGPLDTTEKKPGVLSGGGGWHVMVTVVGQ
jgi:hypothetical protein